MNYQEVIDFYYKEMRYAEHFGDVFYAASCRESYKYWVRKQKEELGFKYYEALRMFPMISLN